MRFNGTFGFAAAIREKVRGRKDKKYETIEIIRNAKHWSNGFLIEAYIEKLSHF